jgi:hypothetical protein
MKTIVLKVRNLPNSTDIDLFVYCMQQDVATAYPKGKVELIPDMGGKRDMCEIVRCKDCTYRGEINCPQYYRRTELSDNYFCADGERK